MFRFLPVPTPTETATPTPTSTPTATPDRFTLTLRTGDNGYEGTADTFIASFDPQVNYNQATLLTLNEQLGDKSRALLKFDMQPIPLGTTILNAELKLHVTYRSGIVVGRSVIVNRLIREWAPESTTWQLSSTGAAWGLPGASAPNNDYISDPSAIFHLGDGDELSFDVTDDVRRWLIGEPNRGWLLRLSDGSDFVLNLASSEHRNVQLRPELVVTLPTGAELTDPTPTPTPHHTPIPSGNGSSPFEKSLEPGWNAFSIPLIPFDPRLPAVLQSIDGSYDRVKWYDNSEWPPRWRYYIPGDTASNLDSISQLIGVWVEMNRADALSVSGLIPTTTVVHLEPGWNQIGYPAAAPQRVEMTLAAIAGSYDKVSVWDNAARQWLTYVPGDEDSPLTHFRPGDAIWIHATQAVDLVIVN